jgi:hypothetical protein
MNKKLSILGLLSLLLVVTYCSNNYFGRVLTRNSSIEPDDVTITPIDVPDGANPDLTYSGVDATFEQPTEPELVNPDITFIMDTSGSMADERDALIDALEGWLLTLENNGFNNYCVGVMRAAHTGSNVGRLVTNGSNPRCLCRDQFTNQEIVQKFSENITSFAVGVRSEEAGIYSYHMALNDAAILNANQADGCFRSDLVQVPFFLADENDQGAVVLDPDNMSNCAGSATTSSGGSVSLTTVDWDNSAFADLDGTFVTTPATNSKYVNNTCDEAKIRLRYYSEATPGADLEYDLTVTPQSVAADLIAYNGDLPTYGSAIIYNSTTFPSGGVESQGWGYNHFADELDADTANLATATPGTQAAFNAEMNELADALTTAKVIGTHQK